ncbi:MAG: radical SAM protein [Hyphomicrobiales bacterium]
MRESRYNIWVEKPQAAYVFNARSGALLRIDAAHYRSLRGFLSDGTTDCPPGVLANLVAGSMLVADDADEVESLARRYRAGRENASRFALTIVTSLGCNFACPYCFEEKHPSIMDAEVQEQVLQLVDDQLPRIGSFHVTWFGGEPLVGKKSLLALSDAFMARCDRGGVAYDADIITNGYLLDAGTCAELAARRVTSAQVGLDGPPDVHDRMRPLVNGKGSFKVILANLHHAVAHLQVSVRVNIDRGNFGSVEELFRLLAAEGLAGKLGVYPGQIVGVRENPLAPSAGYCGCFSNREFAEASREFLRMAGRHGLAAPALPSPTGAPCTAVRQNELVVGSHGELYKCWNSVGNRNEAIGHIGDYRNLDSRVAKWLAYDPFANEECRTCVALPVCMGGCAHHAFEKAQYENRCGSFRHTYREEVAEFIDFAEASGAEGLTRVATLARRMETR